MKNQPRKRYICSRFGHKFEIAIHKTTTVAIIKCVNVSYTGIAVVKGEDIYDRELGISIAMKAALTKYHSDIAGHYAQTAKGFRGKMRHCNKVLAEQITNKRKEIARTCVTE